MPYKSGDSICEEFVTSSATGAAVNADSLPSAAMVRNGVDDGTVTLTVVNVDTGRYKVTGTVPNTYAAGDKVQICVQATLSGTVAKAILPLGVLDSARLADGVNVVKWNGNAVPATNVNGVPLIDVGYVTGQLASTVSGPISANVTQWSGTSVATPDTAGHPKVTVKAGNGPGEVLLASGAVTVGTNTDKTGYSASQVLDKAGYSLTPGERTAIAGGVWDVTRSSHVQVGTFGQGVASVQGDVTGSVASVVGAVGSVSSSVTAGTVLDKSGYALAQTDHSAIAADVWGATRATYAAAGTFGQGVASVQGNVTGSVGSVLQPVTAGTVNDKADFSLSASGLDKIQVHTSAQISEGSSLPAMIAALWRRTFRKVTMTHNQIAMYADDGSTVLCTQALADDGATQMMGPAA